MCVCVCANLKVVKGVGHLCVQGKRIDVIRARQVVLETMALETDTFGVQQCAVCVCNK